MGWLDSVVSRFFSAADRAVLRVQILVIFVFCTLMQLGYYGQREWRRIADERHLQQVLRGWDGLAWYVWLLAVPVMVLMIRRFPLGRSRTLSHVARLVLASFALYLAVATLRFGLRVLPNFWWPSATDAPVNLVSYGNTLLVLLPLDFLTYCGFFATSFAVDYYFKARWRGEETNRLEVQMTRLRSDLVQAELVGLRGQMQPHFIFNSFNAVAALVRQRKNDDAVQLIARISELLRRSLEKNDQAEVPLHEEVEFAQRYLEIEQVRFGPKLQVELLIAPDTRDLLVPNFLLQPLVENAVKHGIARRTRPGTVVVTSAREGDRLRLTVANDAPEEGATWLDFHAMNGLGIGLSNARARLDRSYPGDHRLELMERPDGTVVVELDLPCRPADTIAESLIA